MRAYSKYMHLVLCNCFNVCRVCVITLISLYVDIDSMSPTLTHCWLLSISTFKEIRTVRQKVIAQGAAKCNLLGYECY